MEKQSILSFTDPIQAWLDVPENSLILDERFGNNLHELLFKNKRMMTLELSKILDKLTLDFGEPIVSLINDIQIVTKEGIDKYILVIRYNDKQLAYKVLGA